MARVERVTGVVLYDIIEAPARRLRADINKLLQTAAITKTPGEGRRGNGGGGGGGGGALIIGNGEGRSSLLRC